MEIYGVLVSSLYGPMNTPASKEVAEKLFKMICDEWAGECTDPAKSSYVNRIALELDAFAERAHCKVNCGCFAFQRAFDKGRQEALADKKEAEGI